MRSPSRFTDPSGVESTPNSYFLKELSGAMELVSPCIWSPLQYSSASAFQVVVTVATPCECACIVMRCAFFREIVRTTLTMDMVT
mmetsp:Transcript_12422/g.25280  ORF Transcript_12422/g.25280 Transcript_12422/m.25280 type:complete len:85 (-) Transcript_12422:276-530(-)